MHKKLLVALTIAGILGTSNLWGAENASGPGSLARGLMISHEGRMIFSPCRERSYVEVDDVSPDGMVTSALRKLGLAPDKPLYTELFGQADNGILRAEGINFARVEARCGASLHGTGPWQASGQNPVWSMTTTADGKLRLHMEGQAATESTFSENSDDPSVTRLQLETESGQWELRRQLCYQLDNGFMSGWSATVNSRGKTLAGCAWKP